MSQAITKLQEGGATEKPSIKTFKYIDKDIDHNYIKKAMREGLNDFIKELNIVSGKRIDALYDSANKYLKALDDGSLEAKDMGYQDKNGIIKNNGKRFDPDGLIATYMNRILSSAPAYKQKPAEEPKKEDEEKLPLYSKQKTGSLIFSDLGYTPEDFSQYDNNQKIQALTNVLNELKKNGSNFDFTGSVFDDAAGYENALQGAIDSLSDNELQITDNPYFRRLGFDDYLIGNFKPKEEPKKEEKLEEISDKERELTDLYITPLNGKTLPIPISLGENFYNIDENNTRWDEIGQQLARDYINKYFIPYFNQYNPFVSANDKQGFEDKLNLFTPVTGVLGKVKRPRLELNRNQYISYMLNSMADDEELIPNEETGEYILPFSFNDDGEYKGTIMLWNPRTNELRMDSVANTSYWDVIKDNYDKKHPVPLDVKYHKEGGTLKFLYGGTYEYKGTKKHNAEEKKIKTEMEKSNRTRQQVEKGLQKLQDGNLTTTDFLRISAAAGDIFSMISAWVPGYGTAASAISGAASSINTAIAEGMEGNYNGWQIAKHLGGNLAMDLVGLIPYFGTAGKAAKITKNVAKYTAQIITLANSGKILLDEDTRKSLSKINDGKKDLTLDDWKRIGSALAAVAGLSRIGASAYKMNKMKAATNVGMNTTPAKGKIKLKGGKEVEVTPEQYAKLQEAVKTGGADAAKPLLELYTGIKDASFNKIPFTNKPLRGLITTQKATETPIYDTSKIPSKYGNINDRWSDAGIFNSYVVGSGYAGTASVTPAVSNTTSGTTVPPMNSVLSPAQVRHWSNPAAVSRTTYRYGVDYALPKSGTFTVPGTNHVIAYSEKKGGRLIKAQNGTTIKWRKDPKYVDALAGNTSLWDDWYNVTDDDLINYLNSSTLSSDAINALNNVTTDGFSDKIYNKRGYRAWNENYNNTGLNNFFGYSDAVNDYLGPSTWNRYKAFERLTNLAQQEGGVKTTNGVLTYDPTTKKFTLGEPTANIPDKVTTPESLQKPNDAVDNSTYTDPKWLKNAWTRVQEFRDRDYNPNVSSLARLVGTVATNTHAANRTIDSIKPPMRDAINLQRQIRGGYSEQYPYQVAGNRYFTTAKQQQTSDAELNNRTMLSAADMANLKNIEGANAYNQIYRDTVEKAWQTEAANKEARNNVSWDNLVRFKDAMKAKEDIRNARYLANWKSIHDFLAEKEYGYRDKRSKLAGLNYQQEMEGLQRTMMMDKDNIELQKLKYNLDMDSPTYTDDLARVNELQNILDLRYGKKPYELRRQYYIETAKKGTKVKYKRDRTQSDKAFHKSIKDARDAHLKLMGNLSAVTKHLILKAMT